MPEKRLIQKKEEKIIVREPEPVLVLTADDYLKKSIRQRKTGNILLATGAGLIGSGLFWASRTRGGIEAAAPLVLVVFPGILTSLSSIAFFVTSKQNEKKAIRMGAAAF